MKNHITLVPIFGILTILIILFFLSCRISKQKEEQFAIHTKIQERTRWSFDRLVWQQRDSSLSYWTLKTDSLLYYHPQWGLWAQGGLLEGNHMQAHQSSVTIGKDNIVNEVEQEALLNYSGYLSRKVKENWRILLLGFIIILSAIIIRSIQKTLHSVKISQKRQKY